MTSNITRGMDLMCDVSMCVLDRDGPSAVPFRPKRHTKNSQNMGTKGGHRDT